MTQRTSTWPKFKDPKVVVLYLASFTVNVWALIELHLLAFVLIVPLGLGIGWWTDKEYRRKCDSPKEDS